MKDGKIIKFTIEYSHTSKPEDLDKIQTEKQTEKQKEKPKPKQPLDPNHSHFILVDNARIGFGGEIGFRAVLESAISSVTPEDKIPIVVLVLEVLY